MRYLNILISLIIAFTLTGCGSKSVSASGGGVINTPQVHRATMKPYKVMGKTYYPTMVSTGDTFSGIASWYGPDFHGKKTSNGETYDMHAMTAAHKTFPMNTIVRVTNKRNDKSVTVRVNDRGPFVQNRIIDLSYAAAKRTGLDISGTAPVSVEVLGFNANADKIAQNYAAPKVKQSVVLSDFAVQIGAFRRHSGAKLYTKQFNDKNLGYPAHVSNGQLDGEAIYRVYVSGFRSEDEAYDWIAANKKTYTGAFIVRER